MKEFILAALPYVIIGLSLIIIYTSNRTTIKMIIT